MSRDRLGAIVPFTAFENLHSITDDYSRSVRCQSSREADHVADHLGAEVTASASTTSSRAPMTAR